MALSIATNTSASTAHRFLKGNDMLAGQSLAKLSSGSRIVRASDDAASLAVGTKLRADVATLQQAQVNASHGQSVLQVADGALQQVSDILIRMKSIAAQAATGSVSAVERAYIDEEFQQLSAQLTDISAQTQFNGATLLDGTYEQTFMVGVQTTDTIKVSLKVAAAKGFNIGGLTVIGKDVKGADSTNPDKAITAIDADIDSVLTARATLGGLMSRFDFVGANLSTSVENIDAARATLMDVDVAAEMSNFSSKQVVMQASVSMLAQANQMPQNLLQLLQ